MRNAYLTFLSSALPVIDDELLPPYFDAVSSITNKYVSMSLVKARARSQLNQDQPDDPQEVMVSEAIGREPPPSHGSPPQEMEEPEKELVPIDLTRKLVSHGDPEPPCVPSSSRDKEAHGMVDEPLPGPSHACGLVSGPQGGLEPSWKDLKVSPEKFQARYKLHASQHRVCSELNVSTASST